MKKIIGITLVLLLLSGSVSARESVGESFDFEDYSPGASLSVMPQSGKYGVWNRNNCVDDGVTAETTEKGTSLVLVHKNDMYPGVRYYYKPQYKATEGIHVKYSFKVCGGKGQTAHFFRFRKNASSVSHNILTWEKSNLIKIAGQKVKNGFDVLYGEENEWYDVEVYYDIPLHFLHAKVTWREKEFVYNGIVPFDEMDNVAQILFEDSGKIEEGVSKTYIDNVLIEHTDKIYAENSSVSFADFCPFSDGSVPPEGFEAFNTQSRFNSLYKYAGIFKNGDFLSLRENFDSDVGISKTFAVKARGYMLFKTDICFSDINSDKVLYLGNEKLLTYRNNGQTLLFGNTDTGFVPRTDLIYGINIYADLSAGEYILRLKENDACVLTARYGGSAAEYADKAVFGLENYNALYGGDARMLVNNICLKCVGADEFEAAKEEPTSIKFYTETDGSYEETDALKSGKIKIRIFLKK